jgi:hypothetical protein
MGGTLAWWIFGGLAIAGGTIVYVVTRDGAKVPAKSVCLKDIPEPKFSQVKKAMDGKDVNALRAFALQAMRDGWTCAANELDKAAQAIDAEKKTIAPKTSTTPGELALDPVTKETPADSATLTTSPDDLFDSALTYNASSPRVSCIDWYNALTLSEKTAIESAINAYRYGDATYPKGTTSYLAEVADDFQTRGDWQFANCLRTQVGLSLRFPELTPEEYADAGI